MLSAFVQDVGSDSDVVVELADLRRLVSSNTAREIRERAHLSLSELASSVGVSVATLSMWERGLTRPTGKQALRYRRLLHELNAADSPDPIDDSLGHLATIAVQLARTAGSFGAVDDAGLRSSLLLSISRDLDCVGSVLAWFERVEDNDPRPSRSTLDLRFGLPGGALPFRGEPMPRPAEIEDFVLAHETNDRFVVAYDLLLRSTCELSWAAYELEWPAAAEQLEAVKEALCVARAAFTVLAPLVGPSRPTRTRGDHPDPPFLGRPVPRGREVVA